MKKLILSLSTFIILFSSLAQQNEGVSFSSNNKQLTESFKWAKDKALSFAHDGSDPVGYWYEAALPNREAFCMRDVSHQSIGAEILGLSKHNQNMYLKFAQNISKEKDYCSWWEINRYNKPAPVDYETDKDFWYNLPANFDVIYNANRLYNWTGNKEYINNADLNNFYELSLNEYVDHWDLGHTKVAKRDRTMHLQKPAKGKKWRFGNKRGIPTYNEGGRGETLLGIDMTASLVAAYKAYSKILILQGKTNEAERFMMLAKKEQQFLNDFWWDSNKGKYRSILYADNTFDYFMVGRDLAFSHYILYYNSISDPVKIKSLVDDYVENYNKLIVELKSYLPIIFYENGRSDIANKMLVELCSPENKRRDYPENSYTVIEHFTRGLMGIEADVATNSITTLSRIESQNDWGKISNVPILGTSISVKHKGNTKTTFTNNGTSTIVWNVRIQGKHTHLFVNGKKLAATISDDGSFSFISLTVNSREEVTVSTAK
jgi:hypothetical protein